MWIGVETVRIDIDFLKTRHSLALGFIAVHRQMGQNGFHELIANRAQGIKACQRILEDHTDTSSADAVGRTDVKLVDALIVQPNLALVDIAWGIDQANDRGPSH